jgi:hypothetical protein
MCFKGIIQAFYAREGDGGREKERETKGNNVWKLFRDNSSFSCM